MLEVYSGGLRVYHRRTGLAFVSSPIPQSTRIQAGSPRGIQGARIYLHRKGNSIILKCSDRRNLGHIVQKHPIKQWLRAVRLYKRIALCLTSIIPHRDLHINSSLPTLGFRTITLIFCHVFDHNESLHYRWLSQHRVLCQPPTPS